ncbi:MAG TPA: carboxypeptidase regulatory-like domain-containing protein, partial [Gemmatimonadaceae bacterium]|nr:carboxypeptidase regulatory-like domain-containing protein [Gemmatimonadaceae bacterium]
MLLPASDADAGAQTPLASGVAAHVAGVVHDSLAGAPLDGATVQLVSADGQRLVFRSAVTDGGGAFALDEVPAGRYLLGFLHPLLDSLGLHAPGREVVVVRGERMRVDLAVPPAARIRVALCGGSAASPPAVQLGVVRSAIDRSPVSGAVVEGGWSEYAIGRGTVGHRIARVADTTGSDGRFVLCDVPQAGAAMLRVTRGSERSALVALDLAANGISRRDVYVGQARSARALAPSDTLASEIEMGDGVLRGRVLDRDGARPIAGARVGIAGGPEARTAGSGEWTLTDLPMGTRILEVRAVGYAPTRLPVDVYAG